MELLTTSLLVQADVAMLAAGRQVSYDGASRTASFRRSFLMAYAQRIGERLQEADDAVSASLAGFGGGAALAPVLCDHAGVMV